MAVTAWLSPAQQTKNVSIPGDAYTAYNIPSGGSALQLNINRANNNLVIDDSEIVLQDSSDTVQWYRSSDGQAMHVYQIGTVLSAREYLHVFGHYHYTNGVGGGGTHPTFNAKVAAPDVDPEYLNEDQEESVGIWIGKSGVRKPITIREVNCKGPGNQQVLTWSSGKLSIWTASSDGSMLSGSSKYLSASQEYTYYAQGDMASGSIRDSEINTAYTAGGNTAYDKVKITVVGASFTPFSIIPVNTTQDVSVTLSPNPPGTNITLQLSCLNGSGSAVFAPDGTTSTNITQSTTVKIKGVTASSIASNMTLKAMLGNDMFASNKFSILKVDLNVDSDNDGDIDESDDAIETNAPGVKVHINDDFDEGQTLGSDWVSDNLPNPSGGQHQIIISDSDLKVANLKIEPARLTGVLAWIVPSALKVWWQQSGSWIEVSNVTAYTSAAVPVSLRFEGITPVAGKVKVSFSPQPGSEFPDETSFTVFTGLNIGGVNGTTLCSQVAAAASYTLSNTNGNVWRTGGAQSPSTWISDFRGFLDPICDTSKVTSVDGVNTEPIVIGAYTLEELDTGDIGAVPEDRQRAAVLVHELVEQFNKQVNGMAYNPAHALGIAAEEVVTGGSSRTDTVTYPVPGTIHFRADYAPSIVFEFDIISGKATIQNVSVTR